MKPMTGDILTALTSVPEVMDNGGIVAQVKAFLAQNGEVVMLLVSTMINYMVKPLVKKSWAIPFITFAICIGVMFLLSENSDLKLLIFGGLYLWVLVTVNYVQDKKAVETKMLEDIKGAKYEV